jgi:hypothetical protein
MAAEGKMKGVPALGWWLMLVGSLRLASVWFGFFDIWALRVAVFSQTESECPPRIFPLPPRFNSSRSASPSSCTRVGLRISSHRLAMLWCSWF